MNQMISLIVAMARNGAIGIDNKMPWYLPEDLQHFRSLTMNKPIVMGRKTFEAIGRPLPGRDNIVISRNSDFKAEGITLVGTTMQALQVANHAQEIMIIGGAQIYRFFLPLAQRFYITCIDADIAGDTYFPTWQPDEWEEYERHPPRISPGGIPYYFLTLERRQSGRPSTIKTTNK